MLRQVRLAQREPLEVVGGEVGWKMGSQIITYLGSLVGSLLFTLSGKWSYWIVCEEEWLKTIKRPEENTGEKFLDIGLGNAFFGYDINGTDNKGKSRQV